MSQYSPPNMSQDSQNSQPNKEKERHKMMSQHRFSQNSQPNKEKQRHKMMSQYRSSQTQQSKANKEKQRHKMMSQCRSSSNNSQSQPKNPLLDNDTKTQTISNFVNHTESFRVDYKCELCGMESFTIVFKEHPHRIQRICENNIDVIIASECLLKDEINNVDYAPKYTDYDRYYEYTTDFEIAQMNKLMNWWHNGNFSANSSFEKLTAGWKQLTKFEKMCNNARLCKIQLLKDKWDIEHVNEWVLKSDQRYINFYRHCLRYWQKLNKSVFFKDKIIQQNITCFACGMPTYSESQYSRYLTNPYAREKLTLLEYVEEKEMDWFVCEWCINQCYKRAYAAFVEYQKTSLLYCHKNWSDMTHWKKSLFTVTMLDFRKFALYIAWCDIAQERWRCGQITDVDDSNGCVVEIHPEEKNPKYENLIYDLDLKKVKPHEYFIFQRPSTSRSPLFERQANVDYNVIQFIPEHQVIIDITNASNKIKFNRKTMLGENIDMISNTVTVRIVKNGELMDVALEFIKKHKATFELFSSFEWFV